MVAGRYRVGDAADGDFAGPAHFGRINSVVALGMTFGRAVGPLLVGIPHDSTDSYGAALVLLAATTLFGAVAVLRADAGTRARPQRA